MGASGIFPLHHCEFLSGSLNVVSTQGSAASTVTKKVHISAREFSFWAYRVGQDPSDSESNRLHVDIFRFCFHSFEVYSIDSSKMIGNFPEVSNFNRLFLKLNRFICN